MNNVQEAYEAGFNAALKQAAKVCQKLSYEIESDPESGDLEEEVLMISEALLAAEQDILLCRPDLSSFTEDIK